MLRFILCSFFLGIASASGDEKKVEFKLTDDEKAIVDATNAERKKAALPELKVNEKMVEAARSHAANIAKQDILEHTLDGKTAGDRVKEVGFRFRHTGENIAHNQKTTQEVLESWMNSDGHKANILSKDYEEIGAAVTKNDKGERYWVQVFGTLLP
jgi:uncharacterized protein YkwD